MLCCAGPGQEREMRQLWLNPGPTSGSSIHQSTSSCFEYSADFSRQTSHLKSEGQRMLLCFARPKLRNSLLSASPALQAITQTVRITLDVLNSIAQITGSSAVGVCRCCLTCCATMIPIAKLICRLMNTPLHRRMSTNHMLLEIYIRTHH